MSFEDDFVRSDIAAEDWETLLVPQAELLDARNRFFPGWWTYVQAEGAVNIAPFYRVPCHSPVECEWVRLARPAFARLEIVRVIDADKAEPGSLDRLVVDALGYARMPGFPMLLLTCLIAGVVAESTILVFLGLAISGVVTMIPAIPAFIAAVGLGGLALVSARLLAKWIRRA